MSDKPESKKSTPDVPSSAEKKVPPESKPPEAPKPEPKPEPKKTPAIAAPSKTPEIVFLTRGLTDPKSGEEYPFGKYLKEELPVIAFEKGYVIKKPKPKG